MTIQELTHTSLFLSRTAVFLYFNGGIITLNCKLTFNRFPYQQKAESTHVISELCCFCLIPKPRFQNIWLQQNFSISVELHGQLEAFTQRNTKLFALYAYFVILFLLFFFSQLCFSQWIPIEVFDGKLNTNRQSASSFLLLNKYENKEWLRIKGRVMFWGNNLLIQWI